jgi:acyl carrier protein
LPHWTTYILDKYLNPVPTGVVGELFIGGIGVARGYLNRPDLTAEKFLPNPFSNELGARMYRTGDLARYLPASRGNIEFLGRIDHQVKIRGFRIELGEIEAVLSQHPGVENCVVLAREDIPGNKQLVAYIQSPTQQTLSVRDLRNFLMTKLPEYMVPASFVVLAELPHTPNGKVDRKALPAPTGRQVRTEYVPPRTPTEETLAQIWAEVLHVERVGVLDNFFELGGHSLLATQLLSKIRTAFHIDLPLRSLFNATCIEAIAIVIDKTLQDLEEIEV